MRVAVLDALLSCKVETVVIMDNLGQALLESLKGAKFERWRVVSSLNAFFCKFIASPPDLFTEQHLRLQSRRFRGCHLTFLPLLRFL